MTLTPHTLRLYRPEDWPRPNPTSRSFDKRGARQPDARAKNWGCVNTDNLQAGCRLRLLEKPGEENRSATNHLFLDAAVVRCSGWAGGARAPIT